MLATLVEIPFPIPVGHPRTPGIHVSSIIRNIAFENGVLESDAKEDFSLIEVGGDGRLWWDNLERVDSKGREADTRLRIALGMAWEDWYLGHMPNVTAHPGEFELDEVYLTPDGESIEWVCANGVWRYEHVIHEVKTTEKSLNTVGGDIYSQWLWLTQIKAYCKAAGTTHAMLHVLFLSGDYTYYMRPMLRVWQLAFTTLELDDNWDMLMDYVRFRQRYAKGIY